LLWNDKNQDWSIAYSHIRTSHIFAFFKSAITLFVALLKMWLCDCTFCRSYQKCGCAIALFAALFKCAKKVQSHKRSFEKSKGEKNVQISKSHFFRTLKRAIAHFQSVWLPNPDKNSKFTVKATNFSDLQLSPSPSHYRYIWNIVKFSVIFHLVYLCRMGSRERGKVQSPLLLLPSTFPCLVR